MGAITSIPDKMSANMKEMQTEMMVKQIDAQKGMNLKVRESQMAFGYAQAKERFYWYAGLYSIFTIATPIAWWKGKRAVVFPWALSSFIFWYQFDMFYGNKMIRIRQMAERLLDEDPNLFRLPKNNLLCNDEDYDKILKMHERSYIKNKIAAEKTKADNDILSSN